MDLSTTYLGFELPHPLMPGASPLADDLDMVRRLEDAGAAAMVMRSLFEEQIAGEQLGAATHMDAHGESYAEATTFFPKFDDFVFGPDEYLEQVRRVKAAVSVPVIASLNGISEGGWLSYSKLIEEAGADALELNIYFISTDPQQSPEAVEKTSVGMLEALKKNLRIPVAVKLSPFYSSLAYHAAQLEAAGAEGLVLFNRFYQPDIDVENLEVARSLHFSRSSELLLRLRWLAILSGRVSPSLAATGGVHTALDAIKAVMAGAHAVQMVSALLQRGPSLIGRLRDEIAAWLEEHEYESLRQMQGSMNLLRCPDALAYERANYMHILQTYQP